MEAGPWHRVRVMREPERMQVWFDDEPILAERIPNLELPYLSLQGSWGGTGDTIEFRNLEIRAPAEAAREARLHARARELFAKLKVRSAVAQQIQTEEHL